MKKLIYILLLLPSLVIAQTTTENYVVKKVFNTKRTTVSGLNTIPADSITKIVSYFDGLGRAKQNVAVKAGGNKEDIVTHFEYDALGRQIKDYLPYAIISNDGLFRTGNQASATNQYYLNNYATDFAGVTLPENANAYSEKNIENSPLNRVLEQAAPGADWKLGGNFLPKGYTDGHTIKFEYDTNSSNDAVKSYSVTTIYTNNTYTPALIYNGVYTVNVLTKTITEDENWNSTQTYLKDHTTEEFKNKLGQVVLKRTYNNNITHDTYYVYDNFGNLTYVLPPKVITSDGISSTELSELSYQYKYDHRNRLVEKKIPGKGEEYIVYDNLDRPVLTQDANQRVPSTNEWLFTKYDALGRVVYTGVYDSNSTRLSLQSTFDSKAATSNYETKLTTSGTLGIYYSNSDFPSSNLEVLTVNYYDNYTFDRTTGIGTTAISYGLTSTTNTKGLATGTKVKVLNTSNWITTVNYYDDKARPIYIFSKNDFLQTTDILKTKLDFVGKAKTVTTQHTKSNGNHSTQSIEDVLTYDHAGRLKIQDQSLNGSGIWERVVSNTYDELGQLTSKGVGNNKNSSRLQTVNYNYNVRGWLTNINQDAIADNDLFNFTLKYNDPTSGTALYNGNISQTNWNTLNTDSSTKIYTYTYDALNRIKSAIDNTWRYNLSYVNYDKNGNITSLYRKGPVNTQVTSWGTMDDLTYTYDSGNKLLKVADAAVIDQFGFKDDAVNTATDTTDDFTYDNNGNMKTDTNKGITSITYNHLNLPTTVTIGGNTINYTYDAAGTKLRKVVSGVTTDYAGNYIYKNNALQFFNTAEGYFNVTSTSGNVSGNYVYQYKDHLGNVRLSYADVNGDYKLLSDTGFENGTDGWGGSGATVGIENGRLKVTTQLKYSGTVKNFYESFNAGEKIHVRLEMDKNTTTAPIRVLIKETRVGGYGWYMFGYANNGVFEGTHTVIGNSTQIQIKLDIANAIPSATQYYVDDIIVSRGNLEVVEESNYYPFGLKHKGYNNVTSGGNAVAQKFKYNQGTAGKNFQGKEGKSFKVERQEELGLNLDMTKFRMYDYALGRFTSIDPLADTNPQESLTPYQYAYNNPIQYNDPYGDCPSCIWGAIIGAAVDYGLQVAGNVAKGEGWSSLTNVSGKSILTSAGAGALSGGISSLTKLKKATEVTTVIVEALVDTGISVASQTINNGEVSLENTLLDVTAGQIVGRTSGAIAGKKAANSSKGVKLKQKINEQKNIARGKTKKQGIGKSGAKVEKAESKFNSYIFARSAAAGTTASGAGTKTYYTVKNKVNEQNEQK
tara:strand:- start:8566 stop:12435 length:3870 start_codon:yes stop_codon:yes gene_type:complete